MGTNKSLFLNGAQFGFDVSGVAAGGYTRIRNIPSLDWGIAPGEIFHRPRPLRDGLLRRGRKHGPRTIELTLATEISTSGLTATKIEAARDDEWAAVQNLLYPEQGLFTIKQTRTDYSSASISREILGELQDYRAWTWSPDDAEEGYVGRYDHFLALLPLTFICPFPWFMDTEGTTDVAASTLDGSLRSASITNSGIAQTGLYVSITAASGTATVNITNTTAPGPAAVAGATLTSISPTATPVILDWFYTDPLSWSLMQGTTDLSTKLSTASSIGLTVGVNTIKWQVTSGSLSSGAITIKHRTLWGNP